MTPCSRIKMILFLMVLLTCTFVFAAPAAPRPYFDEQKLQELIEKENPYTSAAKAVKKVKALFGKSSKKESLSPSSSSSSSPSSLSPSSSITPPHPPSSSFPPSSNVPPQPSVPSFPRPPSSKFYLPQSPSTSSRKLSWGPIRELTMRQQAEHWEATKGRTAWRASQKLKGQRQAESSPNQAPVDPVLIEESKRTYTYPPPQSQRSTTPQIAAGRERGGTGYVSGREKPIPEVPRRAVQGPPRPVQVKTSGGGKRGSDRPRTPRPNLNPEPLGHSRFRPPNSTPSPSPSPPRQPQPQPQPQTPPQPQIQPQPQTQPQYFNYGQVPHPGYPASSSQVSNPAASYQEPYSHPWMYWVPVRGHPNPTHPYTYSYGQGAITPPAPSSSSGFGDNDVFYDAHSDYHSDSGSSEDSFDFNRGWRGLL